MLKKGKSGDYPPFREAIKKLTACLKEQNYPTEIRWLMPACCYLFAPTTETEAEYALMPNGLKLGVPLAPCSATLIPTFATNLWAELSKASQSELVRDLFS